MSGSQVSLQYCMNDMVHMRFMTCMVLMGMGLDLISTECSVKCLQVGSLIIPEL